jgi:predicted DNA-binding antitoxin AbrB/MazE fold protein
MDRRENQLVGLDCVPRPSRSAEPLGVLIDMFLIFGGIIMLVVSMLVRAIYENSVLRPWERLDLKDGEMVEIEVKKSPVEQLYGIIKIQNKQ